MNNEAGMREPRAVRHRVNGIDLVVWEWAGAGPPLCFVHATGFHGRVWDQVIARLPDLACYAVDMRGHGRSTKPTPPYNWRVFGEDVAALIRTLGVQDVIGIGHSMGGHSVALAAALAPEYFGALAVIDPVIMPRALYGHAPTEPHFAARRRDRWASPEEMLARFKDRSPFDRWQPAVLRDYCSYGLLPAPDGAGYILACPPAIEAAIYEAASAADIYAEIATIDLPVRVLRSAQHQAGGTWDMLASPTAPDLATCFRFGEDVPLSDYTHFVPMEAPELIARHVREMVDRQARG